MPSTTSVSTTGQNNVDSLLWGEKWGVGGAGTGTALTYAFPGLAGAWWPGSYGLFSEPFDASYAVFNASQQTAAAQALQGWADVANITFTDVSAGTPSSSLGDIRFAIWDENPGASAHGYPPGFLDANVEDGDTWYDATLFSAAPSPGDFSYSTLLHELGHAIGLAHPHDLGGNSTIATAANDWIGVTVMAYRTFEGAATAEGLSTRWPTTPMINDIGVVQYLYGANLTHNVSDTTYSWSIGQGILETIWDAGGTDEIDWSNQSSNAIINLNEGQWSEIGPSYDVRLNAGSSWMTETRTLNIAFGAVIENANGGSGDDQLIGNDIGNMLSGMNGADTIDGGGGDDTLSGGAGADVFLFDALADLTANTDHITDFDVSDSLDFSAIGGLTFVGTGFFNSSPGEVRFYLEATSTIFEIDSDGDAIADHRLSIDNGLFALQESSPGIFIGAAVTGVTATISDATMSEGDTGTADLSFTVTLTGPAPVDVYIDFATANGTASAATDYTGSTGVLVINQGQTSGTIDVSIAGDMDGELDESFTLTIANPLNTLFAGGASQLIAVGTIQNDDIVVIAGTAGNDSLVGTITVDNINGLAGNDTLAGLGSNDTLFGGDGFDRLLGDDGNDSLIGGAFRDTLIGGEGDDTLLGGSGDDQLRSGNGNDLVDGGGGNDSVRAGAGLDTVFGGNGDDTIHGLNNADSLVGDAGIDIMYGGTGNDTLRGGSELDVLFGEEGDDVLIGESGNDYIEGNSGNDSIVGGTFSDTLKGGAGNDTVEGNSGNDIIEGNDGDDFLIGGTGLDTLVGFTGSDTLLGGAGSDILVGLGQSDSIDGGGGDDLIFLGFGADTATGGDGSDTIWGLNGTDLISGEGGIDILRGEQGNDTLLGGDDLDVLFGGDDNDSIVGGIGNDFLFGEGGNDQLFGGSNRDELWGGDGLDLLDGGAKADTLLGGTGNDTLLGGGGSDQLYGMIGNDSLTGGLGNDTEFGGPGADRFVFGAHDGSDIVSDFQDGFDLLEITGGFAFTDLSLIQSGNHVTIAFIALGTTIITLQNTQLNDIDANDFLFT